jgi:hypothetical protein
VSILQDATSLSISVPELEPEPATPAAPVGAPVDEPPAAPLDAEAPRIPKSVYVAGAATLALGVAAGVTGYLYMQHRADAGSEQREPELSQNRRLGTVNLGLTAGAVVGAGVTVYLYWTRPKQSRPRPPTADVHIAPWFGPGLGGLCLQGTL